MQEQQKIIEMFNQIAPTYDKANRILSFGVDSSWRKKACERVLKLSVKNGLDIVDVACGTGDMIVLWQERAEFLHKEIQSIKGIDPSTAMLQIAKEKLPKVEFIEAQAQNLPLKDESVDILSISYGIRNVIERSKALQEFARVLRKDGICVILEFTKVEKGGFIAFFRDIYLKKILPFLGSLISNNKSAYRYLPDSIECFLKQEDLVRELQDVGFTMLEVQGLSFDISSMFIAKKI
ncbi:bifunctional demethylmenaquinone methyltransferase/2-methoxy-6-polyprenyl-1,4-benzoquinol methylase UbiE [Campylobacter sp. MIT 21-1685]|uniref:bifunctional demethylmenaquinone methyltransferase/2-methoxy-6-polyprenyl-1,4-benzoquinol methylase UbiE n=1 Tax=unclassified Campylobacter TaxID=2593542 RepID=UPI00224B4EB3|nr:MULTISPECIES: bifunctional demethylmenaquinone methyltransferase/2-methoxy-6-polyprenyl-1,4-benzoquinol methylase UbiE [unclassified Campylobacter]MCX2683020.1 bifunctional demethylmenaquinone methyltransferase/2-methoxy-6-polyprenyl-1,4-benzoquinol methylase UbiE [Campylobacter sp. MIT 21-1684]MCX2751302.1 bifunctional demethylmenaquinone methyltransferase/2-methoxy-6-polyprenyl-1,4-benzoquinol methylase UbiE [Campylobacter sp. MIT 21-1682]MCX2807501.1 bifunctional demethylmenaquinone methyl